MGPHNAIFSDQNPFWQYSLRQYSNKNSETFLLQAQDQYNLNVNHLLFIGFSASHSRVVDPIMSPHILDWNRSKVGRIRSLRKRVKALNNQKFYKELKNLELYSEWFEQKLFYHTQKVYAGQSNFENNVRQSVSVFFEMTGRELEDGWLQDLIQHLQPTADQ